VKFDPGGGTHTTRNGKVQGNGKLTRGSNSSTPRSSTITSSGSKMLTFGELWSAISA
jgi:hypothetical protein